MPPRKTSRDVSKSTASDPLTLLRTALSKKTKAELTDLVLEFARHDGSILRELSTRFNTAKQPTDIVAATRAAISAATDFDERQMGRSFDYDDEAYGTVKKNFRRLIEAGQLPVVVELALELMKDGSYQAECSDECLMSYDLGQCFNVVITALRRCDFPAETVTAWCQSMLKADRLKCIARDELESLNERFNAMTRPSQSAGRGRSKSTNERTCRPIDAFDEMSRRAKLDPERGHRQ